MNEESFKMYKSANKYIFFIFIYFLTMTSIGVNQNEKSIIFINIFFSKYKSSNLV